MKSFFSTTSISEPRPAPASTLPHLGNLTSGRLLVGNAIWNLIGTCSPILVAVVCLPVLKHALGTDRLGVITLAVLINLQNRSLRRRSASAAAMILMALLPSEVGGADGAGQRPSFGTRSRTEHWYGAAPPHRARHASPLQGRTGRRWRAITRQRVPAA